MKALKERKIKIKMKNKNLSQFLFQYNFLKCTGWEGLNNLIQLLPIFLAAVWIVFTDVASRNFSSNHVNNEFLLLSVIC